MGVTRGVKEKVATLLVRLAHDFAFLIGRPGEFSLITRLVVMPFPLLRGFFT